MATLTIAYTNAVALTITLASLATSSTFVAGEEATAVTNGTNKYDDVLVTGSIMVGTTPTANTSILVYAVAALDEAPTWPDVFDGTDSAETLTSVGVGASFLKFGAVLSVDAATSNVAYPFAFSLAQLFGGIVPKDWTIFVTHNTGVNLNATGGNHNIKYQGIKYDIA